MKSKVKQVIQTIKAGAGAGKVFTPEQVVPYLDKQMRELAASVKEFLILEAEKGHNHKFRRDGAAGFVQSTTVTLTTDGGKISLPDYAINLDEGRKPFSKLVPLASLIAWIKRYRILGRAKGSGKYKKASAISINSTALAIQGAIYKNGIIARPFIKASLEFMNELISAIIEEVLVPQIISIVELFFTTKSN